MVKDLMLFDGILAWDIHSSHGEQVPLSRSLSLSLSSLPLSLSPSLPLSLSLARSLALSLSSHGEQVPLSLSLSRSRSLSVYLGSPVWRARVSFRSKDDIFFANP